MRQSRQRRFQLALFLGVGFILTAFGIVTYATDAFRSLELDTVDARFEIRGDKKPPKDLVVVEIDDVTFDELRRRWPFPRSLHGQVVDRIAPDGPKLIAYDVQFTEPSAREEEDIALAEAIANAGGRVVLSTTEVNNRGETGILGGDEVLKDIDARPGNALLPTDSGGVNRRVSYSVDKLKTFAVAGAEVATRLEVDSADFDEDGAWIDFWGPPRTIKSVSFSRVVEKKIPKGYFKDKLVVVGPSAPSLQDLHAVSTSGDDLMAGAELQANAIDTVRRGLPLKSAPGSLEIASILLLGLVAPVASLRWSPFRALGLALLLGVAFTVAAQLAFNGGTVLAFIWPIGTLILVSIGVLAVHYLTTALERERMRDMFSRFVPKDVVDEVLEQADGARLGGIQREGTVMFSDLRGFTSFAESLPVERVIDILNRYLTEMSEAILAHNGTLVAYMGDGIMAVFGAPVEQGDHADRALAAAREMLGPRLEAFNRYLQSEELGEGFRMGVGLNSGQVMSGNVGSEQRLEYTAIGDTTNTAARLEGMTKGTPHMLFLADSTREFLTDPPDDLVFVDEFEVRGRQARIKLWSIAEEGEEPEPAAAGSESPSEASRSGRRA